MSRNTVWFWAGVRPYVDFGYLGLQFFISFDKMIYYKLNGSLRVIKFLNKKNELISELQIIKNMNITKLEYHQSTPKQIYQYDLTLATVLELSILSFYNYLSIKNIYSPTMKL